MEQIPSRSWPDLNVEITKTRPDYVVYRPLSADGASHDTGNEHVLAFDGPDRSLMILWTQSSAEGQPDQRIAFARSSDNGRTWSPPRILAGPRRPGDGPIASWGFPLVSRSGRLYVLFNQHVGLVDLYHNITGVMAAVYSDDAGATWSPPQRIPMPRSRYDNPDPRLPANWIVWQKPQRLLSDGRYYVGFTRWVSPAVRHAPPIDSWIAAESVVQFMRFENLDDDPQPADIQISYFPPEDGALTVGFPGHPQLSVCQEPSIVRLPDGRFFCVMRTAAGSPYWSLSTDQGVSWSAPLALRRHDAGPVLPHPLSPCPIFDTAGDAAASGRYLLLIHNHDGHYGPWGPTDTLQHRRPICAVHGCFDPAAHQPIRFDEPRLWMDHDGQGLGPPGALRCDLAMYSSVTVRDGQSVLWYPDRKFFVLGKHLPPCPSSASNLPLRGAPESAPPSTAAKTS